MMTVFTPPTVQSFVSNQSQYKHTGNSLTKDQQKEFLSSIRIEENPLSIGKFIKEGISEFVKTTVAELNPITQLINTGIYVTQSLSRGYSYLNRNHERIDETLSDISMSLRNSEGKLFLDVSEISLPISEKLSLQINEIYKLESEYNALLKQLNQYKSDKERLSQSNTNDKVRFEISEKLTELNNNISSFQHQVNKIRSKYDKAIKEFNSLSELKDLQTKAEQAIKDKIFEHEISKLKAYEQRNEILKERNKTEQAQIELQRNSISKQNDLQNKQIETSKLIELKRIGLQKAKDHKNYINRLAQQFVDQHNVNQQQQQQQFSKNEEIKQPSIKQPTIKIPSLLIKFKDYLWLLWLLLIAIIVFIIRQFGFLLDWVLRFLVSLKVFLTNFLYGFSFFFGKSSFYFFLGNTLMPILILCIAIYIISLYFANEKVSEDE